MHNQCELRFYHFSPDILLLWDIPSGTIFLLSEEFLARLNFSAWRIFSEKDEGTIPDDCVSELMTLLEAHSESPTDYVRIPLTRLAEDTVLREMRKFRGGRFIDGSLGDWLSRFSEPRNS